jgi:phospholipid/cholesterol/gamma-HCH transport system substrate-binding protein
VRVRKVLYDLESEAAMHTQTMPRAGRSAESKARWAFLMVLLLGGVAGFAWIVLAAGNYATYQIRTTDSVSGLIVDSPVEFHGVDVGRVARVELIDPRSVSVLLHVRKDAPVTTATVATVTSRGLSSKGFTGYVYVSLEDDDSAGAQPVAVSAGNAYPQLRTAPSRSVNLDMAMSQVNENVQSMARLMQASLDEKTLASLRQALDGMQQVTRTLAANSEKMNAIIVNAERASNRLEPLLESTNQTAKALQTQLLPQAYDALAKMDRLSSTLNSAAGRIERDPSVLVRGAGRRLPGPGESR